MKMKVYIISILSIILLSCKGNKDENVDLTLHPIVSVMGQTLYKVELDAAIPEHLSGKDSSDVADAYIRGWIEDQLMYDKALHNLVDKQTIDKLVEDYKKSLIIQSYQEQMLTQELGKRISEQELENFYNENIDQMKLESPIIKGLYLKIPLESSQLDNMRKWYTQTSDVAIGNIEKNALQHAVNYEYFYDKWVNFDELANTIPGLSISNTSQYLQSNKSINIQDSSFVYLMNIKEYKLAGENAPFEYEKDKLREILVKKKRLNYIKQIQQDLYDKAMSDKEIKFYKEP